MMGLLTTVSLVGSLVLWAGYQAFFVPDNRTLPLTESSSYDDPYSSIRIPQKFLQKPIYKYAEGSPSQLVSDSYGASRIFIPSYKTPRGLDFSSTYPLPGGASLGHRFSSAAADRHQYSSQNLEMLSSVYKEKEEIVSQYISANNIVYNSRAIMDKNRDQTVDRLSITPTQSSTLLENSNNPVMESSSGDLTNQKITLGKLVTIQDSHALNKDSNTSDHHFLEKLDLDSLSIPTTAKLIGNESAYATKTIINDMNPLNVLYTLVTFVKNLENQGKGNFSHTLDNLPPFNETAKLAPSQEQAVADPPNYRRGSARFLAQEIVAKTRFNTEKTAQNKVSNQYTAASQVSTQDIALNQVSTLKTDQNQDNQQDNIAKYQDIPLNENTELTSTGISIIEEFKHPKPDLSSPGQISSFERVETEKAKMLSKEYMQNFGWQGYLLIFFIIIIVLLLVTALILFAASFFTWRRNKRKQTKGFKASNSYKEA